MMMMSIFVEPINFCFFRIGMSFLSVAADALGWMSFGRPIPMGGMK
jgi:hypothetical protein